MIASALWRLPFIERLEEPDEGGDGGRDPAPSSGPGGVLAGAGQAAGVVAAAGQAVWGALSRRRGGADRPAPLAEPAPQSAADSPVTAHPPGPQAPAGPPEAPLQRGPGDQEPPTQRLTGTEEPPTERLEEPVEPPTRQLPGDPGERS